MAKEFLSVIRPAVVAALPGSPTKGDTCVLSGDGHLYTYSGSAWIDNGATGSGTGASGSAVVDFGALPGTDGASVVVTGQATIGTASIVRAWARLAATADHSADEHRVESLRVSAGSIVAGTGFTIFVDCDQGLTYGLFNVDWQWS